MKTKESKRACEDEQGSDPYVGIGHSGKGRKNSVKKRKERHWMKFRHRVVRNLAYAILYPYMRLKYGVRIERFREQGERPYLILMNHQTPFDQFFVGAAFRGAVYYVASEDLFSNGLLSSLIRYLVAPIPIRKQATDASAVLKCLRIAKEGGTIAIAPEGNRTYSGRTCFIHPVIAQIAKRMKLPIALFRIEGGYGVQPRWSDVVRRGKMHAGVSRVIEPEEYAGMQDAELYEQIRAGLYEDEGRVDGIYTSSKRAEYLERAMYVCPFCGLSKFESHGDVIACKKCGRRIRYGEDKRLSGVGFSFPFSFVTGWYDYQEDFVRAMNPGEYTGEPLYRDRVVLREVILYKRKKMLCKNTLVFLYGDRIVTEGATEATCLTMPFARISGISVLGRNKLDIRYDGKVYQMAGEKRFNALKYLNLFYHYKNIGRDSENGEFLGL